MLKKVAIALAGLAALLVIVIAVQPASFSVERTTAIRAPAEVVYAHIEDLQAMDEWSPWVKMDPQLAITYSEPASGVGARSEWHGPQMGRGRLTITRVAPPREIEMRLEMLEPMPATNRVLFTLASSQAGITDVTWRMEGTNGFVGKALSLVMDMDQMVGGEFAKGLAALQTLSEAEVAAR
jgi:uncharacterized protein YndB with AHSA1/START domain